jgi:uncharacterized protein (TIGR02268 family)
MLGLTPTLLLLLTLSSGPDVSSQEEANVWETGARQVELSADTTGEPVEVRVSPGVGTLFVFDAPPSRVEVEARQRFRAVGLEGVMLTLLPEASFLEVGQGRLTAHFSDGAAPSAATFLLRAVPPALAERQLEVHRLPRGLESYSREARALREENAALRREVARLQAAQAQPDGLLGLLVAEEPMYAKGVVAQDIPAVLGGRARGGSLEKWRVRAFKSTQQVALALLLQNRGAQPWRAEGAALRGKAGASLKVLRVWQPGPMAPGESGQVLVEAENAPQAEQGPFTLTLWEAGTRNPVTLSNITFP